jgi:hypothetical protein
MERGQTLKNIRSEMVGLLAVTANAMAQQSWSLKMTVPSEPGIVCNNIDRMLKFYGGIPGLKLVADAKTPPDLSTRFSATPYGYRMVRLQTPYGERIKFVQPNPAQKIPPLRLSA